MAEKIIVEFNRKELKGICQSDCPTSVYKKCQREDKNLIECLLVVSVDFKIKEEK